MKLLYTLLFCCLNIVTFGQLPQHCNTEDKALMMGDSWAQYMYDDGVHNDEFEAYGHADKTLRSEVFEVSLFSSSPNPFGSYYSVSGSLAREWADEVNYGWLQNVRNQLIANAQITTVIISIGGNDVLAGQSGCGWYKNMDLDPNLATRGCGYTNETEFYDLLEGQVNTIITEVLAVRSDLNVVISSYDYPNFNVTTSWVGCAFCDLCDFYACPKRLDLSYDVDGNGSIDGSELITDTEINQMMVNFELRRQNIADGNSRVHFENSMGLTQYAYGYNGNGAGTTPAPTGAPNYTVGGDINYPTDRDYFRLVDVPLWFDAPADPIHLTGGAYAYKAKNQMDNYIFEAFRGMQDDDNHTTLWSEGDNDGYVEILDNSIFNNGLRMGDEDVGWPGLDYDYRSILSFNTSNIPDGATITGASIYIIRSSEEDNPFLFGDRSPVVDIKSGYFGSSEGLEVADGTDGASGTNVGCFVGNGIADEHAIRIDIDASALQHINTTGKTQFRLYFDYADWSDEYINFYDGAGNPGLTTPSQITRNKKKHFESFTRVKTPISEEKYEEETLNESQEMTPREGFVFEEIVVAKTTDNNGVVTEQVRTVMAVEHKGLSKYMSSTYGAPGGGTAPFIDIIYDLPLPIELRSFDVKKKGTNALLDWRVGQGINFRKFEIEHSTDQIMWTNIGTESYDSDLSAYDFTHDKTEKGTNYYRLKMIDVSGEFTYSKIKSLHFGQDVNQINLYPNPIKDQLNVELQAYQNETIDLRIFDILGQVVYSNTIDVREDIFKQMIDMQSLPQGVYVLTVGNRMEVKSFKIVKE